MCTKLLSALILCAALTTQATAEADPFNAAQANHVLKELERLPNTLVVTHSPNPAVAVEDSTARYRYTWQFSTTVESTAGDVTIVEFGSLNLEGDRWLFANFGGKSFTREQFAEWYGCEGAVLHEGTACTDAKNWSRANELQRKRSLWYYFGVDEAGQRVAGSAEIVEDARGAPAEE